MSVNCHYKIAHGLYLMATKIQSRKSGSKKSKKTLWRFPSKRPRIISMYNWYVTATRGASGANKTTELPALFSVNVSLMLTTCLGHKPVIIHTWKPFHSGRSAGYKMHHRRSPIGQKLRKAKKTEEAHSVAKATGLLL